jgi:hypothetical protein
MCGNTPQAKPCFTNGTGVKRQPMKVNLTFYLAPLKAFAQSSAACSLNNDVA